ncbi:TonB-dependent receptor [Flavihumibacter solisilvae]|uniref:TonB-dependent receptor n=1 Tax=Flavihumibacter solisilvae TaxID=1349421 RepID=UPI0009E24B44|nr:TonB-dependent receptor [Flavihumibacter solisilvae]
MNAKNRLLSLVMALLCCTAYALAGSPGPKSEQEKKVSVVCRSKNLKWVINQLEKQTGLLFVYSNDMLDPDKKISVQLRNADLSYALEQIFTPLRIDYELAGKNVLLKVHAGDRLVNISTAVFHAADVEIQGQVLDEQKNPIAGATVLLKGTNSITTTNSDGRFVLHVPEAKGTLIISFVGYRSQEVAITSSNMIVNLAQGDNNLGEVVVVGYGTQRRVSVTGAVDQVRSASLEGRPSVNLTQSLQGLSPNLIIQQTNSEPGAGININIRGVSTLGNNGPLVVIDGIAGGDMNLLNPADIDNISVLKDAGSAAIYGSRSANGVILITTKKGKKNARPIVTYNGMAGIQQPKIWYKPVESFENAILRNQSNVNAGLPPIYTPDQIQAYKDSGSEPWFLDEILQPAMQQQHNLSVSGGNDKTTYLISGAFVNQGSNLVGPSYGLTRYNLRLNLTTEVGRLKLTGTMAYARNQIKDHSSSTSTLIVDAGRVPTYYKLKDEQGRYLTNDVLAEYNPLGILEKGGSRRYNDDNLFTNVTGELMLIKGLKLKGSIGGTIANNHMFEHRRQVDYFPKGSYGLDRNANDRNYKDLFLNTQVMLDYAKSLGNHNITALVGFANESFSSTTTEVRKKYVDNDLGTPTTGTIIDPGTYNSVNGSNETSLNSVFGRAGYNFNDKYFAEFNFRFDGSSKFAKDLRWGFFPSVSAGWRLTEEAFMENYLSRIGSLKLRASYGILGNQNVGNYQYQTTYSNYNNAYGFNNQPVSGTSFTFANPDLQWERAATFNAGVDATFLRNNLLVSFDYFNKLTSDILIRPAVPGLYGGTVADFNAGKVRNTGWEVNASYRIPGKRFNHTVGFNIADTKNEVIYFEGKEQRTGADEMEVILREGLPYNAYIGYRTDGYFQNLDDILNGPTPTGIQVSPGDIRYVDRNKDNIIDDQDKFVLGHPFPRYTFGFNYGLTWKNLDFSLFIQGVGKRDMFLRGELVEPFHFNYSQVMYQHQLDYWTPVNPDARYPRLAPAGSASNTNNYRRGSDLYLFNAAYARLKNIQLGYSLPQHWISKASLQKARIYFVGQNLLTVSGVSFVDPELSEFNNSMKNNGANSGRAYPTPVYFGFGLDITFK